MIPIFLWFLFTSASAAPSFTFVEPSAVTFLIAGMQMRLQWVAKDLPIDATNLTLSLLRSYQTVHTIGRGIDPMQGHYEWKIPETIRNSVDYAVRAHVYFSNGTLYSETTTPRFFLMSRRKSSTCIRSYFD